MSLRRCLISGAAAMLANFLIPSSALASDQEEALCGPQTAPDEPDRLSHLQGDMPPILDQAPADWCSEFSVTGLLNHYIHQVNGTPYDNAHLISPIDAAGAQRSYYEAFREKRTSRPPGHLDLKHGAQPVDVLTGVQELPAMRSEAQVPFTSSDSKSPEIKALKKAIRKGTGEKDEKDEEEGEPDAVSHSVKTFRIANAKLFEAARDKQWTDAAGQTIDHYQELTQSLYGNGDLKVPPFTTELFRTKAPLRFLEKIRETLAQDHPLQVTVHTGSVWPGKCKKRKCGLHSLVIVGAGYSGGVCTVRLRNSWGKHSKRDHGGYLDLPVETLVEAVAEQPGDKSRKAMYTLVWMSPPRPDVSPAYAGKAQHLVGCEGERSEFIGRSIRHYKEHHSFSYSYVDGVQTERDGTRKYYEDGKVVRTERTP